MAGGAEVHVDWVIVVWTMTAGICVAFAGMHVVVWLKQRQAAANLAFSLLSVCVAIVAGLELGLMRAQTTEQFGALQRWVLVPVFVGVVAIIAFVHFYLRTARPWLAHATWVARLVGLVINFSVDPNIFSREVTALRHIELLGSRVAVADAPPGPWLWVDQLGALLLVAFAADASFTLWRHGDAVGRRRALLVGGSLTVFLVLACAQVAAVNSQLIEAPYLVTVPFLIMLGAMGYRLSSDALLAARLAEELRESEDRMTLAASAAHLGIWVWDVPEGTFWITDEGRKIFGWSETERVDYASFERALHPDDRSRVGATMRQALQSGDHFETEYRILLGDGSLRWIATRGRVERSASGNAARMRGAAIDITARKQAELETQSHRAEIAHLSRVAMIGELSGSLAHELNQPLAAILSNAQAAQRFIAADNPDLDELHEILADIVADDERAGEVIRGLRLLLRKGEVRKEPLDLNAVVDEVLRLVRTDLVNHDIELQASLSPGLPVIEGDRVQLQQVLLNLIVNAIDAMTGVAPPDRRLEVRTEPASGGFVLVAVVDRGTGLTPDVKRRLFEPFFTTKPGGLGLGLGICSTIVTSHGGQMTGENNPDGGATFRFSLSTAPPDPS